MIKNPIFLRSDVFFAKFKENQCFPQIRERNWLQWSYRSVNLKKKRQLLQKLHFFTKFVEKKLFLRQYIPLNTNSVQRWTAMMFSVSTSQKIKMTRRNLEFNDWFTPNIVQFLLFSVTYFRRVLRILIYIFLL